MTDEPKKSKKDADPQQMYSDFCERIRNNPVDDTGRSPNEIELRNVSMSYAVQWMVGRQSTPTTDLIALADRIYRFIRFMPDQKGPE